MSLIATKLQSIKPSPTLAVTQKAQELKRQGRKIISLATGEPDFDTPDNIKAAGIKAINSGFTKYTNVDGIPELKTAIHNKLLRENDLDYPVEQIIVGCGGKQVIYNLFMASLNSGDEVIIPAPYWVSYPDIVLLSGGTPVFIECGIADKFKLTPESLAKAITPKTKWLILNSPSNPSGAVYSAAELQQLAVTLRKHPHVQIMSDDIYEHILFQQEKFHNIAQIAPDLKERLFVVNGISKSYSMTGWRIGYGAGNKQLIKAMTIIQSQSTSNPASISQAAAIEALNGTQDFIAVNKANFLLKRNVALKILQNAPNLDCFPPDGAFYLFPACHALFGKTTPSGSTLNSSNDVAEYLLEEAEVAIVPGIAFGLEGYFRISFATSLEELTIACNRIKEACIKLC